MFVNGLNHFLFSVSDLETSIQFYQDVFEAKLRVKGRRTAYFDLNGMWLALNVEENIPRKEISASYTHVAFSIDEADVDHVYDKLEKLGVNILTGAGQGMNGTRNQSISPIQTGINSNSIPERYKIE